MTKSIKEKQRLVAINNHKEFGSELSSDMIKIKLCYKSNFPLENSYYISKNFVKERMHSFLKKRIYEQILPIAKVLSIYEFKIIIHVYVHDNQYGKETATLFSTLNNKKGELIGYLQFSGNKIANSHYNLNNKDPNIIKRVLEIEHLEKIMLAFEEQKQNMELSLLASHKTGNKVISKLRKDFSLHENYYWHSKKKLRKPLLEIVINNDVQYFIKTRFLHTSKRPNRDLKSAISYSDIEYIKFLLENEILELNIDKDFLTMTNIEDIRDIIKLMHY